MEPTPGGGLGPAVGAVAMAVVVAVAVLAIVWAAGGLTHSLYVSPRSLAMAHAPAKPG